MIVVKFGGTSVGDAEAIERATEIVRGRLPRRPLVVVSALSGTTNTLLAIAEQAEKGQLIGALRGVEGLRERHLAETSKLLGDSGGGAEIAADLSVMFDELASLAEALSVLGHMTPRSLDAIAAIGERLSSHLIVAVLCARGVPAQLVAEPSDCSEVGAARNGPQHVPDGLGRGIQRPALPQIADPVCTAVEPDGAPPDPPGRCSLAGSALHATTTSAAVAQPNTQPARLAIPPPLGRRMAPPTAPCLERRSCTATAR